MKRFFAILLILAGLAAMPASMLAQQKVSTKKYKIADLGTRTTKVVLSGNDMLDAALKEEVAALWRISPYEFCTGEEYNSLKKNPDYYFLLLARSQEKKYRGILTLTLMKGGDPAAEDFQKRPVDVASLPFSSAGFPSGREMALMPAFIDIIQDYIAKSMDSDRVGYTGFDVYAGNVRRSGHKRIFFADTDMTPELDSAVIKRYFDEDMVLCDEAEADTQFTSRAYNTLVSYTVSPFDPEKGSLCYKMLIDADSHELYYFAHHKIGDKKWAGFQPKDIRRIAAPRR